MMMLIYDFKWTPQNNKFFGNLYQIFLKQVAYMGYMTAGHATQVEPTKVEVVEVYQVQSAATRTCIYYCYHCWLLIK